MQHIPIVEMCSNSVIYYSELCVIYFQELIHSSIAQTSYHNFLIIYKCFIVLSNSFFIRIFSGFYVGSMCLTSHIQKAALSCAQSLLSKKYLKLILSIHLCLILPFLFLPGTSFTFLPTLFLSVPSRPRHYPGRIMESTTGYTFTPCVGSFISPA